MKKDLYKNVRELVVNYYLYTCDGDYIEDVKDELYNAFCNSLFKFMDSLTEDERENKRDIFYNMVEGMKKKKLFDDYREYDYILDLLTDNEIY